MRLALIGSALVSALAIAVVSMPALADRPLTNINDSKKLREAVKVRNMVAHEKALQAIADANGGTRASGTPGYDASLQYVKRQLEKAGYKTQVLTFDFAFYQENSPSSLEQTSPNAVTYANGPDFATMDYSGSGDVTAQLQNAGGIILPPTPTPSSASGCDPADFAGFVPGRIALIQRGTCTFAQKTTNAQAAGASAVLIFNEGQPGRTDAFGGTLGGPFTIPVLSLSFDLGQTLAGLTNPTMHVVTDTNSEIRPTANLLAETRRGDPNKVVVVGAHLDSVLEGPGIQDNGSGSTAILEIAIQLAKLHGGGHGHWDRGGGHLRNKVRFMWFGAEESGLLGSEDYVSKLSQEEIDKIAVMLNFDMIASPNYARFVYDGDGSDTPDAGPEGSALIERIFLSYFKKQGLFNEPTAFDGRSDYGPFIAEGVGIPAGGLFTGAEVLKSPEQAEIYGGTAGVAFDPCYHQACDTIANLSEQAFDEMSDAAAHAVMYFAKRKIPDRPPAPAAARTARGATSKFLYKGSHLQR
jgi:Zn-dependent M28 family amino/carboxypeptidase